MPREVEINSEYMDELLGRLDIGEPTTQQQSPPPNGNGQHRQSSFDAPAFLQANGVRIHSTKDDGPWGTKYILAECPFDGSHRAPDSYICVSDKGILFHCSHASCSGRKWRDVRQLLDPGCYDKPHHQVSREAGKQSGKEELAAIDNAPPIPLPQLVSLYPELRPAVIGGLLREAEIGNFVSMSKVGKSWLGYGLGLSVATGRFWLDRFPTRAGKVLLVDNELDPRTIAYRVKKVAEEMQVEDTSEFHVKALRGQLVDVYQLEPFFRQFKAGEYQLVILDALYRFWPAKMSENDNAAVTAVMNLVTSYAEKMGSAFCLVHHSSKGNQSGKTVVDVGAGAAALARAADAHVVLREHEEEGAVVMEARTRSWEQPAPMALRWTFPVWQPAGELDPAALKTTVSKTLAKPNRLETIKATVRDALRFPTTKNALKAAAAASGTEINTVVQCLIEAGEIEECEVVTGGGKFLGFQRCQARVGGVGKVGDSDLSGGGAENSLTGSSPLRPRNGKAGTPTRHDEFDEWNRRADLE